MSSIDIQSPYSARNAIKKRSTAFIIEALLLFIFLIASLGVIVQLFVASIDLATHSLHLERAVVAASNTAEKFSASPTSVPTSETVGDLTVKCSITPEKAQAGTIYNATITVYDEDGEIYSLQTARYESGVS